MNNVKYSHIIGREDAINSLQINSALNLQHRPCMPVKIKYKLTTEYIVSSADNITLTTQHLV